MKKRILALLLALTMTCALAAAPSMASGITGAEQTVRALGIMNGDSSGNLNLSGSVTRAQFAKMLVAASTYKDSVGTGGTGYSLFKDVKSSYWASEYIKICVENGWMTGFSDGTFRPDKAVTLEQACSTVLKLLGYDSSTLGGSYPSAQLSKASALGLRDQVTAEKGKAMSRSDCMYLFYNLLTTSTKEGQVYAVTLGYTVSNGQVDYATLVTNNLSGPYISDGASPSLSFTPTAVYLDGKSSTLSAISKYDVYYYNAGMGTVWIYSDRVAGTLTAVSPNATSPTSVTVAGSTYSLASADATYHLSTLGGTSVGDTVMLLLGMDGTVVDAVSGEGVDLDYYGVVLASSVTASTGSSAATAQTKVTVACTDGKSHDFLVNGTKTTYTAGDLVTVSVSSSGTAVTSTSARTASGTVNSAGTKLGSLTLADNVQIIDTAGTAGYTSVYISRLKGVTLSAANVRYYATNSAGQVTDLILKNATGDAWTYGLVSSAVTDSNTNVKSYTVLFDGASKTISSSSGFSVTTGGAAILYGATGAVDTFQNISSGTVTELTDTYARMNGSKYALASGVQVYLYTDGGYYKTSLSSVNAASYTLTGWYDSTSNPAGGLVRILVAVAK